jgi:hypothetical protein
MVQMYRMPIICRWKKDSSLEHEFKAGSGIQSSGFFPNHLGGRLWDICTGEALVPI